MAEELKLHTDDRGFLYEMLRGDNQHFTKFGQVYVIGDARRGVVRAWHRHFQMDEWFCCVSGEALFVLHDPETGDFAEHYLRGASPSLLYVPRLIFHGHQALTDAAVIVAICTEPYFQNRPDEERVPWDHFPGYQWQDLAA
jgi:dTDP-4-dehydrorhamnose 3,5-epimerase